MKILNICKSHIYVYEDGKIVKKPFSKERGIITSFLLPKDIFSLTKKFPSTLSREEIIIEMEQYIYSYPNININKEYQILYKFIELENSIIAEALLIDTEKLSNIFKPIIDKFKYIDFISPSFLSWGEYYNITKTDPLNDVFIYFGRDDAFITAFSEGKYLFHKSLNKLLDLAEKTKLKEEDLIKILSEKGFDRSRYENDELFTKIEAFFSEFFLKVFNLLNFSLNEYQISKFNRIYFYSPFKINKIFEQYENYWELNSISFKPTSIDTEYNHFEYLITIFNAKNYQNEEINFSIFQKPPLFVTTPAGKFLSFVFVLFLIFALWVGYMVYKVDELDKNILSLQKRYFLIKKRSIKYNLLIKTYRKKIALIDNEIDNIKKNINEIDTKLSILYQKYKTPLFYNVLARIAKKLKKYNLKITKLNKNNDFYVLTIKSDYDNTSDIAKFMEDLINDGFKNVKSKTIKNKKNKYISYVEFSYE